MSSSKLGSNGITGRPTHEENQSQAQVPKLDRFASSKMQNLKVAASIITTSREGSS
jgi:hypothetical protein